MNRDTIFNKIAIILEDLHDQHFSLAKSFNEIDLDLLNANAHYLAEHVTLLKKINELDKIHAKNNPDFLQSLENEKINKASFLNNTINQPVVSTEQDFSNSIKNENVETEKAAVEKPIIFNKIEETPRQEFIPTKITPLYDEDEMAVAFKKAEMAAIAALKAPEEIVIEQKTEAVELESVDVLSEMLDETLPIVKSESGFSFKLDEQPEEDKRSFSLEVLPEVENGIEDPRIDPIVILEKEITENTELGRENEQEVEEIETENFTLKMEEEIELENEENSIETPAAELLFTKTDTITLEKPVEKEIVNARMDVNSKLAPTETATLNEKIGRQSEYQTLISQLAKKKITELKSGIGLNEKFLFIQALFNGDANAYNESIDLLNGFTTYSQADQYIRQNLVEKFNWTNKKESVSSFYDILRRRFI